MHMPWGLSIAFHSNLGWLCALTASSYQMSAASLMLDRCLAAIWSRSVPCRR